MKIKIMNTERLIGDLHCFKVILPSVTFKWKSQVMQDCTGFTCHCTVLGLENLNASL